MKGQWVALAALAMLNSADAQPPGRTVGKIPVKCPATLERAPDFQVNPAFKVSPEEAVKAAEAAKLVKCNSKLLQEVFGDAENYYITRFGSPNVIVVHGQTGKVSVREPK